MEDYQQLTINDTSVLFDKERQEIGRDGGPWVRLDFVGDGVCIDAFCEPRINDPAQLRDIAEWLLRQADRLTQ